MDLFYSFLKRNTNNTAYMVIDQANLDNQPLIDYTWVGILSKIRARYASNMENNNLPYVCCFNLPNYPRKGDVEFKHFSSLVELLDELAQISSPKFNNWENCCKITTDLNMNRDIPFYQISIKQISLP